MIDDPETPALVDKVQKKDWLETLAEPFTNWAETLRRMFVTFLIFLAAASAVMLAVGLFRWAFEPTGITITEANSVKIEFQGKTTSVLSVGAPGGENGPWVDSGITVKAGQKVHIRSSGRVCIAAHRLAERLLDHRVPPQPWVGPDGLSADYPWAYEVRDVDTYRKRSLLAPAANFGQLLAQISGQSAEVRPTNPDAIIVVGKEKILEIKQNGRLYLTVNEIWLSPELEGTWVVPIKDCPNYYRERLRADVKSWVRRRGPVTQASSLRQWWQAGSNSGLPTAEDLRATTDEQEVEICLERILHDDVRTQQEYIRIQETLRSEWRDHIVRNRYWNVWYDDNAGSFAVTVEIE